MLYTLPQYHYLPESRLPYSPSPYLDPFSAVQRSLADDALRGYHHGQNYLCSRQAEEAALYQSIYSAKQREIARLQRDAEYTHALAVIAAHRQRAEEAVRRERILSEYRRQQELAKLRQVLLAQLSQAPVPETKACPTIQICAPAPTPNSTPNIVVNDLKARLGQEVDPDIAQTLRNILFSLSPQTSTPQASQDAVESIPVQDKGKERAHDSDKPNPEPKPNAYDAAMEDFLHAFFRPVPRTGEAGPSGTRATATATTETNQTKHVPVEEKPSQISTEVPSASKPSEEEIESPDSETEVTPQMRTKALSKIREIEASFHKLESEFRLPVNLDHYPQGGLDNDDAVSVSSTGSDISRLLPFTSNNSSVHAYENSLNSLLERLDSIESRGDPQVREARKDVVKDIETALAAVESEISKRAELTFAEQQQENSPVDDDNSSANLAAPLDDVSETCLLPGVQIISTPETKTETPSNAVTLETNPAANEQYQSSSPVVLSTPFTEFTPDVAQPLMPHDDDQVVSDLAAQEMVVEEKLLDRLLPASSSVIPQSLGKSKVDESDAEDDVVVVAESDDQVHTTGGEEWTELNA